MKQNKKKLQERIDNLVRKQLGLAFSEPLNESVEDQKLNKLIESMISLQLNEETEDVVEEPILRPFGIINLKGMDANKFIESDKFKWLKDARIKDADIEIKGNKIIWHSGNWVDGNYDYDNCTWKGGKWLKKGVKKPKELCCNEGKTMKIKKNRKALQEVIDNMINKVQGKEYFTSLNESVEDQRLNKLVESMIRKQLNEARDFDYMLLDRLVSDCEYFLHHGGRDKKVLWAGSVDAQIDKMKEIYNSFSEEEKPEWIDMKKIEEYEEKMKDDSVNESEVDFKFTNEELDRAIKTLEEKKEKVQKQIEKGDFSKVNERTLKGFIRNYEKQIKDLESKKNLDEKCNKEMIESMIKKQLKK